MNKVKLAITKLNYNIAAHNSYIYQKRFKKKAIQATGYYLQLHRMHNGNNRGAVEIVGISHSSR